METIINVKVIDQTLQITNAPTISSGGQDDVKIKFDFCSLWEGFAKIGVFYNAKELAFNVVLDENNECKVPNEVLTKAGKFYFGVFGTSGTTRKTTDILSIKVVEGSFVEGVEPEDPTPEIYQQMLDIHAAIIEKVNNIHNDIVAIQKDSYVKGVFDQNSGNGIHFWVGTQAEYDALYASDSIDETCYYIITDEATSEE